MKNIALEIKAPLKTLLTLAGLLIGSLSFAGVDTEVDENGVILAGHDVVSYFTENAAVEGSSKFTAVHNEAIYYFSTSNNRDKFKATPEKFAPQYGGFCAYGAALGKKFDIDGKAFEILDGKLYVNKNLDVYETWVEDKAENVTEANKQWPVIANVAADKL
jgi:YHS domain-containing protein